MSVRQRCAHRRPARWSAAAALGLALVSPSCDDSQSPGGTAHDYVAHYDAASGRFDLRFAAPTARTRTLKLVTTAVRFDSMARRLHVTVAIHSDDPSVRLGPRGVIVLDFAPADVWPANAGCVPPDSTDLPEPCMFGYYYAYGADHSLDPGETSDPVEWIFDDPSATDLSFHADLWWPHGARE